MNTNSILSLAVLAAGVIATGFALPTAAADQTGGDTHTGTTTVKLQYVHAVRQNGMVDPKHDAACKKQLSDPNSKFVGMPVKTEYSIDPKTLMMSAESTFPTPHSTQLLELTSKLDALGIKGVYAFMAARPAELPGANVFFSISEKFTDAKSTFLIINPKEDYNCVISSAKAPFKTAESAKFGMEEKTK